MKRIFYILILFPLFTHSADDKTAQWNTLLEQVRLLSSGGLEASSSVAIGIQNALNHGKIMGIIVGTNQDYKNIFLRPLEEDIHPTSLPDMKPLRYINNANGLNTLPLTSIMMGSLMPMLGNTLISYKAKINAILLQNTNIHDIYPHQLSNYPNLKTIVLPNTTPEGSRLANSERNPNITFMYEPMSARFRIIKP